LRCMMSGSLTYRPHSFLCESSSTMFARSEREN
jgi:hypothetical protein